MKVLKVIGGVILFFVAGNIILTMFLSVENFVDSIPWYIMIPLTLCGMGMVFSYQDKKN